MSVNLGYRSLNSNELVILLHHYHKLPTRDFRWFPEVKYTRFEFIS